MDGGKSIGWWVKNQDLVKFDGPFLMENTKKMFGQVFTIIDDDSNGEIDSGDFATMPGAMDKCGRSSRWSSPPSPLLLRGTL